MSQKNKNNDKSKVPTIILTVCVTLFALCYVGLYWWLFQETVTAGQPAFILLVVTIVPVMMIVGIIGVARQRMKEIKRGELDEAKKY